MAGLIEGDPVTMTQLVESRKIIPGDTIVLLPGVYTPLTAGEAGGRAEAGKGVYIVKMRGTDERPITIRPLVPGTVRINGGIEIHSAYAQNIILQGLEIAPTPTSREMPRAEIDFPDCVYCTAPGCAFYGNYLHDGSQGFMIYGTGGCDVSENIIVNVGWNESDGSHGTGIYTHNNSGGAFLIKNNLFHAFGDHSLNMWSKSTNGVKDYLCAENVVLHRTLFCGCEAGICADNVIEDNHVWGDPIRLGRPSPLNGEVIVRRNRVFNSNAALKFYWQLASAITDNLFVSNNYPIEHISALSESANSFTGNTYRTTNPAWFAHIDSVPTSFQAWQALGYDADSQFLATHPTVNETFVYPFSKSAVWLGMVVVWNWETLDTVTVDLSGIVELGVGDVVELRNGQDPTGDAQTLTLDANKCVSVDMQAVNHSVAAPIGWTAPATTFPTFGCFVVNKA